MKATRLLKLIRDVQVAAIRCAFDVGSRDLFSRAEWDDLHAVDDGRGLFLDWRDGYSGDTHQMHPIGCLIDVAGQRSRKSLHFR